MSLKHVVDAFNTSVGNSTRKLVLIKLAYNSDDDGECCISYKLIADQCEISRISAIDHIKALEKMGLIVKKQRKKTADENLSNFYCLRVGGEPKATLGIKER